MISDFAITILRYAYLFLLWVFVLSTISLVRTDIFSKKKSMTNANRKSTEDRSIPPNSRPAQNNRHVPKFIRVTQGIATGDYFDLSTLQGEYEFTIGRKADNAIAIPDGVVSAEHIKIYAEGDDYFLEDMFSSNGTTINDKLIDGGVPYQLAVGDQIRLGRNVLEVTSG